jgi:hypothetical protein
VASFGVSGAAELELRARRRLEKSPAKGMMSGATRRKGADPWGPGFEAGRRGVCASTSETSEGFSLVESTALLDAALVDSAVVGSDGGTI